MIEGQPQRLSGSDELNQNIGRAAGKYTYELVRVPDEHTRFTADEYATEELGLTVDQALLAVDRAKAQAAARPNASPTATTVPHNSMPPKRLPFDSTYFYHYPKDSTQDHQGNALN